MTTATAPQVSRNDVDYVLTNPRAVVVLDLADGRIYPDPGTGRDPFDSPTLLVLFTVDDARHYMAEAAGKRDPLGKVTRALNLELYALAARGEIPTAEEVAATLAELAQLDAEVIRLRAI